MTAAEIPSAESILKQLNGLWTGIGGQAGANDGVLRACSMTLVVVTPPDTDLALMLGELMHAHPARAVVVTLSGDDAAPLAAEVQAECWLPFGRKEQICCERVEILAGVENAGPVPRLVNALIASDLPVVLYQRSGHGAPAQLLAELAARADKVIVDSGTVEALESHLEDVRHLGVGGRRVADLAWTRLTRWRAMLAQFFDDPEQLRRLPAVTEVAIEWEGPAEPVSAFYLTAWLEQALGWRLTRSARRVGDCGRPRVKSVRLWGEDVNVCVTVEQSRATRLEMDRQERANIMPWLSESELLAEELSILGRDAVFESVLDRLPRLIRGAA